MTVHVMLDLETFGTAPNAAIVQAAAIAFDPRPAAEAAVNADGVVILASFSVNLSLQSALLAGGAIDITTIEWWRSQDKKVSASLSEGRVLPYAEGIRELVAFITTQKPECIWAHGASFDFPILKSAILAVGAQQLPHGRERDTKTLFKLADFKRPVREGTHNAKQDCYWQIVDLLDCARINKWELR